MTVTVGEFNELKIEMVESFSRLDSALSMCMDPLTLHEGRKILGSMATLHHQVSFVTLKLGIANRKITDVFDSEPEAEEFISLCKNVIGICEQLSIKKAA